MIAHDIAAALAKCLQADLTHAMQFGELYEDNAQRQVKVSCIGAAKYRADEAKALLNKSSAFKECHESGKRPFDVPYFRYGVVSRDWDRLKQQFPGYSVSRLYVYTDRCADVLAVSVYLAGPQKDHTGRQYNIEYIF